MQGQLNYCKTSIPSGTIGYTKIGSGRPLVMINRYAATLYNWDSSLIEALAQNFTVYLLDLRLVGVSQSHNAEDISGCVADIREAIDTLTIEQPIILGWSFGGVIVQQVYKVYSHNISGMILLSSFFDPGLACPEFSDLSMTLDKELNEAEKLELYRLMVSETPSIQYPNRLKQCTLKVDNYDYRYINSAKELHNKFVLSSPASTDADLRAIRVPTLILNSRNDKSFPSFAHEQLFNHIPESKLIVYATGGHLLIHHHGAEVASDITTFFKRSPLC